MDVSTPPILYDASVGGKVRHALAVMRTDGYLFVFDRATGEPIVPIEERPVKQDVRLKTAPTEPIPAGTDRVGPNCAEPDVTPAGFSAGCYFDPVFYDRPDVVTPFITVRQAPMSYDPRTKYFYVAAGVSPWIFRRVEDPYIRVGGHPPGAKEYGLVAAIDSVTHKIAWQKRSPWVLTGGSGIMTTAGDLLFRMEGDGNFLAFNAKTGEQLWKFQTGSVTGPTVLSLTGGAPSAAYEVNGVEYITVAMSKALWAFKLNGTEAQRAAPPVPPTEYGFQGIVENLGPGGEIGMAVLQPSNDPDVQHYVEEDSLTPLRAQVPTGQPVKFTNYGTKTHTIVAADSSWTTGPIAPGRSAIITIGKPGKYIYFATEFPWTRGQLIVQ
jgi:glucose dehydrogenase